MAVAMAPVSGSNAGTTMIPGLNVNGLSVDVTGEPNRTVPLVVGVIEDPGGYNDPVYGRDLETPGPRSATAIQS